MKSFHVEFDVEQPKLSTILDVISKEVSNLKVSQNEVGLTVTAPGKRKKQLILTCDNSPIYACVYKWIEGMSDGSHFNIEDIRSTLGRHGFKPTNSSCVMSQIMKNTSLCSHVGRGRYCRQVKATG